jgi:hypothetical protein
METEMSNSRQIVTIRFNEASNEFISYDENGDWHTRCDASKAPATEGRKLAEYMYHKDEIGTVSIVNGETCVEIL